MQRPITFVYDRLAAAIDGIAVTPGPLPRKLGAVWGSLRELRPTDLPWPLARRHGAFLEAVAELNARDNVVLLQSPFEGLSEAEARRLIDRLIELFCAVSEEVAERRARPRAQ